MWKGKLPLRRPLTGQILYCRLHRCLGSLAADACSQFSRFFLTCFGKFLDLSLRPIGKALRFGKQLTSRLLAARWRVKQPNRNPDSKSK